MKIYHNRGENSVTLGLTSRKFENKLASMQGYDKKEMKSIMKRFKKKGEKIRSVVISYTWGYRTKEPGIQYSRVKFPYGTKITPQELLNFASVDMEEKYGYFVSQGSDETIRPGDNKPLPYFLREVSFLFIGENDKQKFSENAPQTNKKTTTKQQKTGPASDSYF
jgi:hypothetical protein